MAEDPSQDQRAALDASEGSCIERFGLDARLIRLGFHNLSGLSFQFQ